MELLHYTEYKKILSEQGRSQKWVSRTLGCSYSLVHKYFHGNRPMKKEKIERMHKMLGLE